jgi:hypothetical protein
MHGASTRVRCRESLLELADAYETLARDAAQAGA